MKRLSPTLFNVLLVALLLSAVFVLAYGDLSDFAALADADGRVRDWRPVVLYEIRLPRIALALLTGAVLGLTGNAMQGLLQNPLASAGLLGSSAGATTVSVFLLYYLTLPAWGLLIGGVFGALISFLLVFVIAGHRGTTVMILAGVAVNTLLAACIALLLSNAKSPWALAELYRWLQGSLAYARFSTLSVALPFVLVGIALVAYNRRYIDSLTFGEDSAKTMGINPKCAFFATALGISLCVGAVIPMTGAIGFIGLIAPHLARLLFKVRPSRLYLGSALIGALLLLLADMLVWRVTFFERIHVGTLTSIIGAPFLVWILAIQRRAKRYD